MENCYKDVGEGEQGAFNAVTVVTYSAQLSCTTTSCREKQSGALAMYSTMKRMTASSKVLLTEVASKWANPTIRRRCSFESSLQTYSCPALRDPHTRGRCQLPSRASVGGCYGPCCPTSLAPSVVPASHMTARGSIGAPCPPRPPCPPCPPYPRWTIGVLEASPQERQEQRTFGRHFVHWPARSRG